MAATKCCFKWAAGAIKLIAKNLVGYYWEGVTVTICMGNGHQGNFLSFMQGWENLPLFLSFSLPTSPSLSLFFIRRRKIEHALSAARAQTQKSRFALSLSFSFSRPSLSLCYFSLIVDETWVEVQSLVSCPQSRTPRKLFLSRGLYLPFPGLEIEDENIGWVKKNVLFEFPDQSKTFETGFVKKRSTVHKKSSIVSKTKRTNQEIIRANATKLQFASE